MTFLERFSCLLGKQYLFKQESGTYYNRALSTYQTKKEARDWLYTQILKEEWLI